MPASALLVLAAAAANPASGLAWLEGTHCTEGAPTQTCERWGPMEGAMMLGTGQTVRDGRTTGFEFMRITLDGETAVFHGSPEGAPSVAFPEAARGPDWIRFENPDHDYPQRISYRREGEVLIAEISLLDGSRVMRWSYTGVPKD